jgi:hypothetical protein
MEEIMQWIKDRAVNCLIYGTVILGIGFVLYSAFLKPTTTQKTTVQDGGVVNYYWKDAKVAPGFGGCVAIKTMKDK